nr:hypothetical protein [Lachnospiraceae bacterium]
MERQLPIKTSVSEIKSRAYTEEEFVVPELVPVPGEPESEEEEEGRQAEEEMSRQAEEEDSQAGKGERQRAEEKGRQTEE